VSLAIVLNKVPTDGKKKIIFGVTAGILSTATDGLAGILNIHYLFKFLPEHAASFWLLVVTAGGVLLLAQNAVIPAVSRLIAQSNKEVTSQSIRNLIWTIHRTTLGICFTMLAGAIIVYFSYLEPLSSKNSLGPEAGWTWVLYSFSIVAAFEATTLFSIVNGLGEVGLDKVMRIASSITGVVISWIGLTIGFGLPALGVASLASSITMLISSVYILRNLLIKKSITTKTVRNKSSKGDLPLKNSALMADIGKLTGLTLMSYFVINAGLFVIEKRFGLVAVSQYAPLIRVVSLLCTISIIIPHTVYPYVSKTWSQGDLRTHRILYLNSISSAILVYVASAAAVFCLAPHIIPRWIGEKNYLGGEVLLWILLFHGLVVWNTAFVSPVLASVGNAFVLPSVVNLVLVLTLLWPMSTVFGLKGIPIAMIVGSLPTSIWVAVRSYFIMLKR